MKRLLALTLMLLCFAVPALAETALSLSHNNTFDVPFTNGYLGLDVDYGTEEAFFHDLFTVYDTSYTVKNDEAATPIGNLLKLLATQQWDAFKEDNVRRTYYAWHLSDNLSNWRVDPAVINAITASDLVIPDHGYVKEVEEGVFVTFDFAHFETTKDPAEHPSFFGYKLAFTIDAESRDSFTLTPWTASRFSAWQKLTDGEWTDVTTDKELTVTNPQPGDKYRFVYRANLVVDGQPLEGTFEGFEYTFFLAEPPVIVSPTKDQTVTVAEETGKLDLTIEATNATEYEWQVLVDGKWLTLTDPSADPKLGASGFVASVHDGLKLRCVARNDYGEAVSPIFTLKVIPAAVPQTGDGAPLALYAGAMVLIACVLVFLRRRAAR